MQRTEQMRHELRSWKVVFSHNPSAFWMLKCNENARNAREIINLKDTKD